MENFMNQLKISDSFRRHTHLCAIAIAATMAGVITFAAPARAEVVYTPADVTISGNGSIRLDLNHDGITDFTIAASDGHSMCYFANEFYGMDTLFPATGNGVVASNCAGSA